MAGDGTRRREEFLERYRAMSLLQLALLEAEYAPDEFEPEARWAVEQALYERREGLDSLCAGSSREEMESGSPAVQQAARGLGALDIAEMPAEVTE